MVSSTVLWCTIQLPLSHTDAITYLLFFALSWIWAQKPSAMWNCLTLSLTRCPMVFFAAAFPPLLTHSRCFHSRSLFRTVTEAKTSPFARILWNTWKSLSECTSGQIWTSRSYPSPVRFSPEASPLLSCPLSCWGLCVRPVKELQRKEECFDSDTILHVLLTTLRRRAISFRTSLQSQPENNPNLLKVPLFNFRTTSGVK